MFIYYSEKKNLGNADYEIEYGNITNCLHKFKSFQVSDNNIYYTNS